MEEMFNFDERLYTLDVSKVDQYEVPEYIDPNENLSDETNSLGTVRCYRPDPKQLIQLAIIVWQVATMDRNRQPPHTRYFELAETRCTVTREILKSLLLPFCGGDVGKARDLCITLLRRNKEFLDKYICNWKIIPKPKDIWIDKESRGIFIARSGDSEVVGVNPMSYVFIYSPENKGVLHLNLYPIENVFLKHLLWDFFI